MAEENKTPEVELDTDGVNEESVDIESPKEPDESFAQKENVDLGYTDVTQSGKSAKELLQETKEGPKEPEPEPVEQKVEEDKGDLEDYSDKVQKRIKKLTFQVREAERREKAAIEYAKGIKDKYDSINEKYEETDTNYRRRYWDWTSTCGEICRERLAGDDCWPSFRFARGSGE